MPKKMFKQVGFACAVLVIGVLLIDQMTYTVKTEFVVPYTEKVLQTQYGSSATINFLKRVESDRTKIVYFMVTHEGQHYLEVYAYRKSSISHAYQVLHPVSLKVTADEVVNKSIVLEDFRDKVLILYGMNSPYNIEVKRHSKLDGTYYASKSKYYLYTFGDIERMYFYYVNALGQE